MGGNQDVDVPAFPQQVTLATTWESETAECGEGTDSIDTLVLDKYNTNDTLSPNTTCGDEEHSSMDSVFTERFEGGSLHT